MRTEEPRPVRLEDYRPPDWLVTTVDLDVSLHPTATRVRARLTLEPNPNGTAGAPLVLDGDGLTAATVNAAHSLSRGDDVGTLEACKRADFVVHDCEDYRELAYFFGVEHARTVFKGGRKVFERA